jgi:glycosyltransferase involved in cell wall biosynthesis
MPGRPIALFLPDLTGGGAERATLALGTGLVEAGQAVDLVLARDAGPLRGEVAPAVTVVDLGAGRTAAAARALGRYLRSRRPLALVSALTHANVVAALTTRMAAPRIPVVVCQHTTLSTLLASGTPTERLLRPLVGPAYRRAAAVVAVSEGVAADLSATIGLPRRAITVIRNPVRLQLARELARTPVDDPWFAAGQPPVAIAIGRVSAAKDYGTLLRALSTLRDRHTLRTVILGDGTDSPEFAETLRRHGLEGQVRGLGFVANPFKYLARSEVLVLSSRREGLPTVLIEAMALGVPVVATDCRSGPREILEDGRLGDLVPVGDAEALARAIDGALTAPAERRARAAEFAGAATQYDPAVVTDRYLRLLEPIGAGA